MWRKFIYVRLVLFSMFDDVIVYSKDTLAVLSFLQELGCKKVMVVFEKASDKSLLLPSDLDRFDLDVVFGLIISDVKSAQKYSKKFDYLLAQPTRAMLDCKLVKLYYGAENLEDRKDGLHYRSSGLNHVGAKLMTDKMYLFDLRLLFGRDREVHLGRMKQNAVFLRKYAASFDVFSFASDVLDVRLMKERKLFCELL